MARWRMETMCDNCPFAKSGKGLTLRRTLRPGRWIEILDCLRADGHFLCHKTTHDTGDGSKLLCAGAIAWQEKHNCVGQMQRWMERIDYIYGKRAAASAKESFQQIAERNKP